MKIKTRINKNKLIKMYLSGMKKGTICKKYGLDLNYLEKVIWDYQKENAIRLYINGENENNICKVLKINKSLLSIWTKNFTCYTNKNIQNKNKPDGFSNWIDKIVK